LGRKNRVLFGGTIEVKRIFSLAKPGGERPPPAGQKREL